MRGIHYPTWNNYQGAEWGHTTFWSCGTDWARAAALCDDSASFHARMTRCARRVGDMDAAAAHARTSARCDAQRMDALARMVRARS